MLKRHLLSVGFASVFVAMSALALAQGKSADDADKKAKDPGVKVERGAGGKKVYRITSGFVIEGRIQKPNAFYVLQRSQINYDWAKLTQEFVPKILDTVKKAPF